MYRILTLFPFLFLLACNNSSISNQSFLVNTWVLDTLYLRQDMRAEFNKDCAEMLQKIKGKNLFVFNENGDFQCVIEEERIQGKWKLTEDGILLHNERGEPSFMKLVELREHKMILEISVNLNGQTIALLQELKPSSQSIEELIQEKKPKSACQTPRYQNSLPGLPGIKPLFFDLEEASNCAQKEKRPLLLIVSQLNCVECIKEMAYFADPRLQKYLNNNYHVVMLYLDAKNNAEETRTLGEQHQQWLDMNKINKEAPFYLSYHPVSKTILGTLDRIEDDIALKRFLVESLAAFEQ